MKHFKNIANVVFVITFITMIGCASSIEVVVGMLTNHR